MKKLIFFIPFIFSLVVNAQNKQDSINLKSCLRMCLIMYADNSGSIDSLATVQMQQWVKNMSLIPAEKDQVEIGIYSFDDDYDTWCSPNGDRDTIQEAIDLFCEFGAGGGTNPLYGLDSIRSIFAKRIEKKPDEWQVLIINSDYYWDQDSLCREKIKSLISSDVVVILSIPKSYDKIRDIGEKGDDPTDEKNFLLLKELGCEGIRSRFSRLKQILEELEPKKPCG